MWYATCQFREIVISDSTIIRLSIQVDFDDLLPPTKTALTEYGYVIRTCFNSADILKEQWQGSDSWITGSDFRDDPPSLFTFDLLGDNSWQSVTNILIQIAYVFVTDGGVAEEQFVEANISFREITLEQLVRIALSDSMSPDLPPFVVSPAVVFTPPVLFLETGILSGMKQFLPGGHFIEKHPGGFSLYRADKTLLPVPSSFFTDFSRSTTNQKIIGPAGQVAIFSEKVDSTETTVRIYNLMRGSISYEFTTKLTHLLNTGFSPDGRFMLTRTALCSFILIDIATSAITGNWHIEDNFTDCVVFVDNNGNGSIAGTNAVYSISQGASDFMRFAYPLHLKNIVSGLVMVTPEGNVPFFIAKLSRLNDQSRNQLIWPGKSIADDVWNQLCINGYQFIEIGHIGQNEILIVTDQQVILINLQTKKITTYSPGYGSITKAVSEKDAVRTSLWLTCENAFVGIDLG